VTQRTHAAEAALHAPPLWRRIADDLAAAIAQGEYAAGDTLPTALALSERYGVHRHTVRQAFRHLAERGLVSVEQGRGTFVTPQRFPYKIGRRVSFRENLGAAAATARGIVLESAVAPASPQVAAALDLAAGTPVWEIRTLNEAGDTPMSVSLHYLEQARFPGLPARVQECGGSYTRVFATYGIARYERLSTRLTARAATGLEARLLRLSDGAPVLHSSGLDGTEDGKPLQLAETAFPGERMEMLIEMER
jgi:GntR family transcriptional regulator, phosphonate transport system regulatory protein